MTPVQEAALGARVLALFLDTHKRGEDAALAERIQRVGARVALASDRPQLLYQFITIDAAAWNAFSFPGGAICVPEGLIRLYDGSDDELAFVLAHEIAHVALRHHVERLRLQGALAHDALEEHLLAVVTGRLERAAELEADRYGALYLVRAGYRYTAALEALERLAHASSGPAEDSAHPLYGERLAALGEFRGELDRSIEAFSLGTAALTAGRAADAISFLGLFVAQFPSSVGGRVNLGMAYLASVRMRSGTVGGLAETLPLLPEADVFLRGSIDHGDVEQARRQFSAALELDHDSVEALAGLALSEMRLGRLQAARERLEHAVEVRPTDATLSLCLGNVEYVAGHYERAAALYDRALELSVGLPEATKNLALVAERQGRIEHARALWRKLTQDARLAKEARDRLAALDDDMRLPDALLSDARDGTEARSLEEPPRQRGVGGLAQVAPSAAEMGRTFLRLGDLPRAVAALQAATELYPDDPRVWSDLTAALLARATEADRPEDLVEALAAAERGYRSDPTRPEVAFNRALALERLYLERAALEAWRQLEAGSTPGSRPWAAARARIANLTREPPDADPLESRLLQASLQIGALDALVRAERPAVVAWVDERVIRRWVEGDLASGDPLWTVARAAAEALVRVAGDRSLVDALTLPDRSALKLYFTAQEHRARGEIEKEASDLRELLKVCPERCRPFTDEAGLRLAIYDFYRPDLDAAEERLQRLTDAEQRGYLSLAGEVHWMLGLIQALRTRLREALSHYAHAGELFDRAAEPGRVAAIELRLAGLQRMLGDGREHWRRCYRALAGMRHVVEPRERQHILFSSGIAVQEAGYAQAAVFFFDTAVELARTDGDPAGIMHASLSRALARHELGDSEGADDDLELAARTFPEVPAGPLRGSLAAEQQAARGRIRRTTNPVTAVALLDEAQDYFRRSQSDDRQAPILLDRGLALEALGRVHEAEADLLAGIEGYERHRRNLPESSSISYFDRSQELFDAMVRLQVARLDDPATGWAFAERSRGRELLDRLAGDGSAPTGPLPIDVVRNELPRGTALVTYDTLDDRLIVWVLTREGVEQATTAVARTRLNRLVAHLLSGTRPDSTTAFPRDTARELYELLLGPVEGALAGATSLIVVADDALHRVPFAALVDPSTDRYLIEQRSVSVVPSATVLVHALRRSRTAASRSSVLAIGDPSFDTRLFPELGRLPGARAEARAVAELYPRSRLLVGDEATSKAFLELVGRHPVLHLAGHALTDLEFPEHSRLALAPDNDGSDGGALSARELYGVDLAQTRLVVLAACSTASGKVSRGEGALSLARPFLAAGVPSVVASLWNIDDDASVVLFQRFHREWLDGRTASEALRAAQLELLRSPDRRLSAPAAWAALELFGSPSLVVGEGER